MDVTVKNLDEVRRYISGIPESSLPIVKKEVGRALLEADASIKNNTDLKTRTGQLFKSIQTRLSGNSIATFEASIFTDSIYAPVHENGATIRAKNKYSRVPGGPYLNIPTRSNKTPAGVMRMKAREVFRRGGYVRPIGNGKFGVFMGSQMMFFLKKQVEIPKRLNMVKETEDVVPTMLSRIAASIGVN